MDKRAFLGKVQSLLTMYKLGQFGGQILPEDVLVGLVPVVELPEVLTFGMSLDYKRPVYPLWQSIAQAYSVADDRWIFNPSMVQNYNFEELQDVLTLYKIAIQPNRHTQIWQRIAKAIVQSSNQKNVQGLLEASLYDVAILKSIVQKERKSEFPYLSGPKIFNYWLYVLEKYAGVSWKNRSMISIAPDTHILKATVKLGLCSQDVLRGTAKDREFVADCWAEVLTGTGIDPIDVHTPLWLWSRSGFPPIEL
ncbi:hypothetical protein [Bacillus andreraoultii]|uniref:hypothetical protein n=1 Tax=Bacillus andreraoultii TaxID=1499685 RepID=UPI00053AE96C|nr:hypothetical protein [Bacillus andreraoultii]